MGAPGLIYLDSSAIVKLVAAEPESEALFELLNSGGPPVSSALTKVEVRRATRRPNAPEAVSIRGDQVLERIALLRVDEATLERAAELEPLELRTLDAIHLAAALSIRDHLEAFVVYDRRLAEAAEGMGLPVASPA